MEFAPSLLRIVSALGQASAKLVDLVRSSWWIERDSDRLTMQYLLGVTRLSPYIRRCYLYFALGL